MKLLTADEMRAMDKEAIEKYGVAGIVLMENAGRGATDFFCSQFSELWPGPVLVMAGKGNNGGDGYVIARHMANRGWLVRTVVLAEQEAITGDAAANLEILLRSGHDVLFAPSEDALDEVLQDQDDALLVIDAIFGNGLSSIVRGHYAKAIDWINASGAAVAAVDMPSGIEATTGQVLGRCVMAECSATFALPKVGQVLLPAAEYGGELEVVDIGMPALLADRAGDNHVFVDEEEARRLLPDRPLSGHKGTFGHLLVIAGSPGKSGAAAMTAEGGGRIGAGLVTVGCPESIHSVLENKLTEAMTAPLPDVGGRLSLQALEDIQQLWNDKQSLALGPGLGQGEETVALVRRIIRECHLPLVIDADGLNALAEKPDILLERAAGTAVLTPHPGEMARMTGETVARIQQDRIGAARSFAEKYRVFVVLKGARTIVAFPDGRVRINGSGNPGMASGGMGDVLTGIIGGLISQGVPLDDAATLGVFLHGLAADRLSCELGEAGMLATDLLREIPATRYYLQHQGVIDA